MNILVTGGSGFLGSHTVLELIDAGHEVVVVDNLSNSSKKSLEVVSGMVGKKIPFYQVDIRDYENLSCIFKEYDFDTVIDFAACKAVGESVSNPLKYFDNNFAGLINLLKVMDEYEVKSLIFSSSATVYGDSDDLPFTEGHSKGIPTNPYGRTKSVAEDMLIDLCKSDPDWEVCILRYFNPVGAHPSGKIGEDPRGIPANLMPYITKVASGQLDKLRVFGNTYHTCDGTGVRDYIHVVDLAKAHVAALYADEVPGEEIANGLHIYNVGTGYGVSVLRLVNTFIEVNGVDVPFEITNKREGDVATSFCDPTKIREELGWEAELTVEDMCRDAWNWQVKNPKGYGE